MQCKRRSYLAEGSQGQLGGPVTPAPASGQVLPQAPPATLQHGPLLEQAPLPQAHLPQVPGRAHQAPDCPPPGRGEAAGAGAARPSLPFRSVNRAGAPGYDPGLQRHHLLPWQLTRVGCLSRLFDGLGRRAVGFDDFRRNGLMLPASEQSARILGLPLHRGPHAQYNRMVIDRVGMIELGWSRERLRRGRDAAMATAAFRLGLLQQALRRRLLEPGRQRRMVLNGRDPALADAAFAELDAMVDALWSAAELADGQAGG